MKKFETKQDVNVVNVYNALFGDMERWNEFKVCAIDDIKSRMREHIIRNNDSMKENNKSYLDTFFNPDVSFNESEDRAWRSVTKLMHECLAGYILDEFVDVEKYDEFFVNTIQEELERVIENIRYAIGDMCANDEKGEPDLDAIWCNDEIDITEDLVTE